jgi:cytochrome c peroxidase
MLRFAVAFTLILFLVFSNAHSGKGEHRVMNIAELGEMLFNDPILSIDSSISCASCHRPEFAFADTVAFSAGIGGHLTRRNTPSAMNMADREIFMWDGRAPSLEAQMLLPLEHAHEMGFQRDSAVARLRHSTKYGPLFKQVFGKEAELKFLQAAIAYFERSLETANTPNDRWLNDLAGGLSEEQIKGRELFFNKANCIKCHFSPDFTGDEFRNIGLFDGITHQDTGRYEITRDSADIGKFKVPGLRNVAVTAPYMHNGMFSTLEEVIEYYNDPDRFVPNAINRDPDIVKLNLSAAEKKQLVAFLHGLTDDRFLSKTQALGQ